MHACTFDEQARLLDIAADEIGDRVPLINGVYADGSLEAARIARMAEAGGATALLCFPPHSLRMGGVRHRPEMARAHFETIAAATDLPLIVFQYADETAYALDTLVELAEDIPTVTAVKDWSPAQIHERHVRVLQSLPRPVNVLSTNSAWLMSSLVMGANGLLSGAGSVIADLQVALFEAVQADDMAGAKALATRIWLTSEVFYADPFGDMHNRMKEALSCSAARIARWCARPWSSCRPPRSPASPKPSTPPACAQRARQACKRRARQRSRGPLSSRLSPLLEKARPRSH